MNRLLIVGLLLAPLACSNSGNGTTGTGGSTGAGGLPGGRGGTTGTGGAAGTTGAGGGAAGTTGAGGDIAGTTGAGGGAAGTTGAGGGVAGTTGAGGGLAGATGNGGSGGKGGASGGKGGASGGSGGSGAAGTTGTGGASQIRASVLQHHNDLARDGLYIDAALTTTAAAGMKIDTNFANATVTGSVYAQPLYLAGSGSTPDLVIVATEQNNVYGFNAATGAKVWTSSVGTPGSHPTGAGASGDLPCGGITPVVGVTGTPVIDASTRIVYLDAMTVDTTSGSRVVKHMVNAIDADTGNVHKTNGWPVDLNASAMSGSTAFQSSLQNQRAALTLVGGKLFIPFGGHIGDCGGYHGWVVGVTAIAATSTMAPTVSAWSTRAIAGGVWGASGIASDGTSLFFSTGNSKSSASAGPNTSSGDTNSSNWLDGETVYKFPTSLAAPAMATAADYFVPNNWVKLDDADADIGGTGPMLVNPAGAPALVVALGKDGNAYLLNRSNLGGYGSAPLAIMQVSGTPPANGMVSTNGSIINAAVAYTTAIGTYVVFKGKGTSCPSGQTGGLTAVRITPGPTSTAAPTMSLAWCGGPATSYSPAVSQTDASGANTIVWVVGSDNKLHGVDGDMGQTVRFDGGATAMSAVQSIQTPIVANGRVYVASNSQVYAFTP